MRLDDVETLVAAGRATARQVEAALDKIYRALETSAATSLLSGIDVCDAQIATSVVGVFSIFESRLQSAFNLSKPFEEVTKRLKASGHTSAAEQFDDYRLAVNVLKHGLGPSHEKLLARADRLSFKVQKASGDLHEEGDVCPPTDLIVVSVEFLQRCCDLVEKGWAVVQSSTADS